MIRENFLPHIFLGKKKYLSPIVGALSTTPVKTSILLLLNPVNSAKEKYLSSNRVSTELIRAMTGGGSLSNVDHLLELGEERCDGKKNWDDTNVATLKGLFRDLKGTYRCPILRSKNTSAWLSIRGTKVSGTLLSAT